MASLFPLALFPQSPSVGLLLAATDLAADPLLTRFFLYRFYGGEIMDKYELDKDTRSGNFGIARLMRNKVTKELVAMKCIERGPKIDENVAREIINHRSLRHPNIIRFKEVILTLTHLAIVMEYAAGGELFERICNAGRFSEDEINLQSYFYVTKQLWAL